MSECWDNQAEQQGEAQATSDQECSCAPHCDLLPSLPRRRDSGIAGVGGPSYDAVVVATRAPGRATATVARAWVAICSDTEPKSKRPIVPSSRPPTMSQDHLVADTVVLLLLGVLLLLDARVHVEGR